MRSVRWALACAPLAGCPRPVALPGPPAECEALYAVPLAESDAGMCTEEALLLAYARAKPERALSQCEIRCGFAGSGYWLVLVPDAGFRGRVTCTRDDASVSIAVREGVEVPAGHVAQWVTFGAGELMVWPGPKVPVAGCGYERGTGSADVELSAPGPGALCGRAYTVFDDQVDLRAVMVPPVLPGARFTLGESTGDLKATCRLELMPDGRTAWVFEVDPLARGVVQCTAPHATSPKLDLGPPTTRLPDGVDVEERCGDSR